MAPGTLRAFRLANSLDRHLAVGDRFDIGPLLRSVAFPHDGYLVSVTEGDIRLLELSADQHPIDLELELPDDLDTVDEHYAQELADWRERFGTQRSNGLATSQLSEIAVRVLRSGGAVKAVRSGDLPDDTPVAAMLRYPM